MATTTATITSNILNSSSTEEVWKPDWSLLSDSELALIQTQTGIDDVEEFKRHVEDVVGRARKIHGYFCLNRILFLKSKFNNLPAYPDVLELGRTRAGAIFLDIGCCLGHDTRKAVMDGYPIENMIASDLVPEFWDLGHELFKSTPETFPVPFIPGDAFDDNFIPNRPPFLEPPTTEKPSLQSLVPLKSLALLQGHISVIHASALFHLFHEESQRRLARKLASLLSPLPGSIIFGIHRGSVGPEPEERENVRGERIWCHSVESWKKLWVGGGEGDEEGGVFPHGKVKVEAEIRQRPNADGGMLVWSVERI